MRKEFQYVETNTNLGTGRHKIPPLQHLDVDFLLHRQILWPAVRQS